MHHGAHGSPEPRMVRDRQGELKLPAPCSVSSFPIPQSAIGAPHSTYRSVTSTLNPIRESLCAVIKAASLVSNWPTLTR